MATDLDGLQWPRLAHATIWLFGVGGEPYDSFLIGDMLATPVLYSFNFPKLTTGESVSTWEDLLDE